MKTGLETEVSALEQLVTMGGGDDPRLLQEQTDAQEETLMHQVEDRPLLQKQKELDADDDASADGSESSSSGDESQETAKPRHHLLVDHDTELFQLQERLEAVHKIFFEEYDKKRTHALGGRVAALRGEKAASKDKDVDLKLVPDIKDIMPLYKAQVLGGAVIVFSGVIPLGQDLQNAEVSLWAKTFGVVILKNIGKRVTHLVAGRNRTAKVREATRWPNIKIVTTQWLYDSLINWKHLDEDPYLLPVHPDDRGEPLSPSSRDLIDNSWISSSDEATNVTDDDASDEMFKDAGLTEASPLSYDEDDQAAVHDELKEFLGSDDESESDSEAWAEDATEPSRKRKRGEENDGNEDDESTDEDNDDADTKGSRLSQRIKRSYERSTGLREVATAGGSETEETRFEKGQFPAPDDDDEGEEVGAAVGEQETQSDTAVDDSDADDFEREMMAAFDDPDYSKEAGADAASAE
jgi:RNA polymerase II subunit A-like phosphatase